MVKNSLEPILIKASRGTNQYDKVFLIMNRCFQLEPLSLSIIHSRRLDDAFARLKAALDGGSFGIWTRVIFDNATRVLYRVGFHNQLNKEPLRRLSLCLQGSSPYCFSQH